MRLQALKARPRRRRLPPDLGERQAGAVAPNVLDRTFEANGSLTSPMSGQRKAGSMWPLTWGESGCQMVKAP